MSVIFCCSEVFSSKRHHAQGNILLTNEMMFTVPSVNKSLLELHAAVELLSYLNSAVRLHFYGRGIC